MNKYVNSSIILRNRPREKAINKINILQICRVMNSNLKYCLKLIAYVWFSKIQRGKCLPPSSHDVTRPTTTTLTLYLHKTPIDYANIFIGGFSSARFDLLYMLNATFIVFVLISFIEKTFYIDHNYTFRFKIIWFKKL